MIDVIPFNDWLFRIQRTKKLTDGKVKEYACEVFGIGMNTCYTYCRENNCHVVINRKKHTMTLVREVSKCAYVL